jgi:hypothetical protein
LALNTIKQNLQLAQEMMKKYANQKRSERQHAVGDMAYLKLQPYRHNTLGIHKALKLHSKYYGPFKVLQKIGQVAYKLLLPADCSIHHVFHVSQLKKHIGTKVVPQADLPLTDPEGNIQVQPESLMQRCLKPRNNEPVVQWLIKWVNLPESAATLLISSAKSFRILTLEGKGLNGGALSALEVKKKPNGGKDSNRLNGYDAGISFHHAVDAVFFLELLLQGSVRFSPTLHCFSA